MLSPRGFAIGGALLCALASHANAGQKWDLSLGAGMGVTPQYEGSQHLDLFVLPVLEASYHISATADFYIASIKGLGVNINQDAYTLDAGIGYRSGLYTTDDFGLFQCDPPELEGMDDPDETATFKLMVSTNLPVWNAAISWEKGTDSDNDGQTLELTGNYSFHASQTLFGKLGLHARWADDEYADAYFSISPAEAKPSRRTFTAEGGIYALGASVEVNYLLSRQDFLLASLELSELTGDVTDSDLVREPLQGIFFLAFIHAF